MSGRASNTGSKSECSLLTVGLLTHDSAAKNNATNPFSIAYNSALVIRPSARFRVHFAMQLSQSSAKRFGSGDQRGATPCAQCVRRCAEMRFCRSCGNRLGEGPASIRTVDCLMARPRRTRNSILNMLRRAGPWLDNTQWSAVSPARLGLSGMTWMWIVLGLFFASGGGLSMLKLRVPRSGLRRCFRRHVLWCG